MDIHKKMNELIKLSEVFLIATVDLRGFPTVITVSKPLWREGIFQLQFYLDEFGETVKNIQRNPKGSVCCYEELEYASLLLKGTFTVKAVDVTNNDFSMKLTPYQKELCHEKPVLVTFEANIARIHFDRKTTEIII